MQVGFLFPCGRRSFTIMVFIQSKKTGIVLKATALCCSSQRNALFYVLTDGGEAFFRNIPIDGYVQLLAKPMAQRGNRNAQHMGNDIQSQWRGEVAIDIFQCFSGQGRQRNIFAAWLAVGQLLTDQQLCCGRLQQDCLFFLGQFSLRCL